MSHEVLILRNCFVTEEGCLVHSHVTIRDGFIVSIEKSGQSYGRFEHTSQKIREERSEVDDSVMTIIECAGRILSHGFIDIQMNGAFGVDFSSNSITSEDILNVATKLPRFGVTHFCPTLVSCSKERYEKLIPLIGNMCIQDRSKDDVRGRANLVGMHLEGPFFCASKRGAHEKCNIHESLENDCIEKVYHSSAETISEAGVSIVTLAPEISGALPQIETLSQNGVIVSMGHTDCSMSDGVKAVDHGASLITHLYNAMRPFHHREPGLLGLLQNSTSIYYSIIADGLHSHPQSVKMAYALSKNVVLVTDCMAAMGLGDGCFKLGEESVIVEGGKAVIKGTNTLAGSVASMESCVKSFHEFAECSVCEVLNAAVKNPAHVLKLSHKIGSIEIGRRADLVLLDFDLQVLKTIIFGSVVFSQ